MEHSTRGPGCSGPQGEVPRQRQSSRIWAAGWRGEVQVLALRFHVGRHCAIEFPRRPATSHKQWCPYYHGTTVQQVPLYIKGKENVGSDWGIITSRLSRSGNKSNTML